MDDERSNKLAEEDCNRQSDGLYRVSRFLLKTSLGVAGGPLAVLASEFFDLIVTEPSAARRDRFLSDLGRRLDALEKAGSITLDRLLDNDEAAAVVSRATLAAMRSSGEQKLSALKEAAAKGLVDAAEGRAGAAQVVIGFLDRMTEYHVIVLAWKCDVPRRFSLGAIEDPTNLMARRSVLFGQEVVEDPSELIDPVSVHNHGPFQLFAERSVYLSFQLARADLVAMGLLEPIVSMEIDSVWRDGDARVTQEIRGYRVSMLGKTVRAYLATGDT